MTTTDDTLYQFEITNDQQAMALALIQAGFGMLTTTPNPRVGCVIVKDRRVIGAGFTQPPGGHHAEIQAMANAAARGADVRGATVYVTLEPCTMCAGAVSFARLRRLYFGAADDKGGAVTSGVRFFAQPTCHHVPEIYAGLGEVESAAMLRTFFAERR